MALRRKPDSGDGPGWSLRPVTESSASGRFSTQVTIHAVGEFDLAAAPDVRRVIGEEARGARPPVLIAVDLSRVTFIDAAMLGALVTERRMLMRMGSDLTLTGVTAWTRRLIEICGLSQTLGL